jgi:thiol:disulfide interchange protein DsbC
MTRSSAAPATGGTPSSRLAGLQGRALLAGLGVLASLATGPVQADEAAIRKTLAERMPNLAKVDEIRPAPMPGLYELRIGGDIFYADETANFLIEGAIFDTKTQTDLTKERVDKLIAINFDQLPTKDAMVIKQGNGSRKMAVFADPNCGYCKRLEKDLLTLKDVTIYTYMIAILGPDSNAKARDIWCSKDAMKTWRSWMIDGVSPARNIDKCDSAAIDRNQQVARRHKVNGTPAIVFEDGTRSPGAMPAAQIEKQLSTISSASRKS